MKPLTKYVEGTFSEKEFEAFSKELIIAKRDRDKRKEWERKLKEEYAVEKTSPKNQLTKSKGRFLLLSIAASVLFLLLSLFAISIYTTPNYLQIVDDEISSLSIMSDQSVLRKGKQDINSIRQAASMAYAGKHYDQSIELWQQIIGYKKMKESDYFYLALCHLKKEVPNPEKTIVWLQKAKSLNANAHKEEIAWVLSLAYLKQGEEENAAKELSKIIRENNYKAVEAKKILDLLNN